MQSMDIGPTSIPIEDRQATVDFELATRLYTQTAADVAPTVFFGPLEGPPSLKGRSITEDLWTLLSIPVSHFSELDQDFERLRKWALDGHLIEAGFPSMTATSICLEMQRLFTQEQHKKNVWLGAAHKELRQKMASEAIRRGSDMADELVEWAEWDEKEHREEEEGRLLVEHSRGVFGWEIVVCLDFAPGAESIKDAVERHRANFERTLWMFQGKCEGRSSDEAVELYLSSRGFTTTHFKWLAQRQMLGWSNKKISDQAGLHEATIRSGMRKAASLMGLAFSDLRKLPLGRPKGTIETHRRHRVSP